MYDGNICATGEDLHGGDDVIDDDRKSRKATPDDGDYVNIVIGKTFCQTNLLIVSFLLIANHLQLLE